MLEQLSKNPEIQSFLDGYPKHQWRKCIEAGLLFGIRKLSESSRRPSYQDMLTILGEAQEDTIRLALQNMRREIEEISGKVESIEKRPKIDQNLKIPRINTSELEFAKPSKRESPSGGSSRSKRQVFLPRQGSYGTIPKPSAERKIPKYLKKVQSKIKGDVLKDIAEFSNKSEIRSNSVIDFDSQRDSSREIKEPNVEIRKNLASPHGERGFNIKEPNVMPLEKIRSLKEESEVFKIADEFLSNPFTSYLTGGYKYQ